VALFMDVHRGVYGLTAESVHREGHGFIPDEIVEVKGGR
jgi:hypothetical protein